MFFYVFIFSCFLMPKITLKNPLKNFGLLNNTTFIQCLRQHLAADNPSTITQIASAATKNRGGQKQLNKSPTEKEIATKPLLNEIRLRILTPPYNNIISWESKNVTYFCDLLPPRALNLLIRQIIANMTRNGFFQFRPFLPPQLPHSPTLLYGCRR